MLCPHCGSATPSDANRCITCGKTVTVSAPKQAQRPAPPKPAAAPRPAAPKQAARPTADPRSARKKAVAARTGQPRKASPRPVSARPANPQPVPVQHAPQPGQPVQYAPQPGQPVQYAQQPGQPVQYAPQQQTHMIQQPMPGQSPVGTQQIIIQQNVPARRRKRQKSPHSRVAYVLLGLFLGGFGAHNFYSGYSGKAVLQLILTFLVIPSPFVAIWVLIEICTVNTDAQGRVFQ